MTYTPSKFPPASTDTITGSVIASSVGSTATELLRVTVDRTGYWGAGGYIHVGSGTPEGSGITLTLELRYNGTQRASAAFSAASGCVSYGGGVLCAPVLISSGQTISLYATKTYNNVHTIDAQSLRAFFQPTIDYAH